MNHVGEPDCEYRNDRPESRVVGQWRAPLPIQCVEACIAQALNDPLPSSWNRPA